MLDSLQAKLGLKAMAHFSLVVEHVKSLKRNKLTLLNPGDTLAKVSAMCYRVSCALNLNQEDHTRLISAK